MKIIFLSFVLWFIGFLATIPAFACSCATDIVIDGKPVVKTVKEKIAEELNESSAVFSGKVLRVRKNWRKINSQEYKGLAASETIVIFEIENVWKKKLRKRITIFTGLSGADCGYPFVVGKKYLVYAHGERDLWISICSRTDLLSKAGEDVKILNRLKQKSVK